LSKSFKC